VIKIHCLHSAENQASFRYRVEQFLPFRKEYGTDIGIMPLPEDERSSVQKYIADIFSNEYQKN
jgi:hypothetical protein